jgi:hypothetical protein
VFDDICIYLVVLFVERNLTEFWWEVLKDRDHADDRSMVKKRVK